MARLRLKIFLLPLLALLLVVCYKTYLAGGETKERLTVVPTVEKRPKKTSFHGNFKSLSDFKNLQQRKRKLGVVSSPSKRKEGNAWFENQNLHKFRWRGSRVIESKFTGNDSLDNKGGEFRIVHPFSFPQPAFSRSSAKLLHSYWVNELQKYLKSIQGKELSLVTSTIEHTDVLLNWLIAAFIKIDPPLKNVLVLSMDYHLHSSLIRHKISSLYVHKNMVVEASAHVNLVFSQVHVVRMAVLRLMNHYGYDVVNYDCDAVLLKNPQPLFDSYRDVDLIGTFGKGPDVLYLKWGVTLNTGVMVMRSNPNMELFWEQMPYSKDPPTTDDQNSINYCLEYMGVKWTNYNSRDKIEDRSRYIRGSVELPVPPEGGKSRELSVMLMSYETVCRHICNPDKRESYYVWHPLAIAENRTVTRKKSEAKLGNAWHLRDNWKQLSEENHNLTGTEWLQLISYS